VRRVLIDTGPLVAILSPEERRHELCSSVLKSLANPPITCWPVITEATWLLRGFPFAIKGLLSSINAGIIEILQVNSMEANQIAMIMDRFASLRPQFADAMLVYLAHRESIDTIFTLDRRDFSVYRTARKKPFRLLPE
jgi:predicted nucleic acid-binding protein